MFTYDNYKDDYSDYAEPEAKKKKITIFDFFRWGVYLVAASILVIFFIRIATLRDPKDAETLLNNEKIQTEINNLDEEIDKRQRQMLTSKDDIKKSTAELQAEAVKQLDGKATLGNIMAFSFEIT